ncbi:radical SAM protein, partial [Brachyspira hampsonii]|nr:radical SAM protein [Brachyspira hampsonii]
VKKDLKRINKIIKKKVNVITIGGGEPLLNPRCKDYILLANKYAKNVTIGTNGILLLKQNDDFWKVLRDTNTRLEVTRYPIKLGRN